MNEEFKIPDSLFAPASPTTLPSPLAVTPPSPATCAPPGTTTEASPWPARLPFDLALGIDGMDDLELRYDLSADKLMYLMAQPEFQRQVKAHREDIVANGISFKQKAKLQAETYLAEVDKIISDKSVSPTVRMDAIKSTVKWAGLEPRPDTATATGNQTTRLVFQWADGSGQVAVEVASGDTRESND